MSFQSIKEATGLAKPIDNEFNFPILNNNNNDYYNEFLRDSLNVLQLEIETLVNNSKIVNNEKKILHNFRIIRNYIIPLSYVIYSYIYIKYQKEQINRQLRLENDLTYNMLSKYFFNHKNPIIKKVNVFFYLNLEGKEKNIKKNNNKINKKDEDEIITALKIDDENNVNRKIIKFLDEINKTLPSNDLDKKCEDIIKGLNKLLDKLRKLVQDLIIIEKKVSNSSNGTINKSLFNKYFTSNIKNNNNKIKVDELLDNISFEKIDKNTKLFEIYRIEYNSCVTQYQNILKDLKNINLNILYINSENYGIIEDNISMERINAYINTYSYTELPKYSNETFKNLKNNNNTIINHLNDKIDLINILLNFELKNNTNKERFKKYFDEIQESKKKIIDETKKVLDNNDEKIKIYKNIYKSIYNYEIIELYYLSKIKKVDISSTSIPSILIENNLNDYKKINIKDYQFEFDKNFRDYKKDDNSNENIQDLQNLSSDLTIIKKDIDDNSKELDEYITKKNLTATKSDIEKVQLKKLEDDLGKKKTLIVTYTSYLSNPSIRAFFTKDSTIIPSEKSLKEQEIKTMELSKPKNITDQINILLRNFYNSLINNIDIEITGISQNITYLKTKLKELEYEINSDTFKQSIMKLKITNITEYIGKISEILTYFNKIKEDKENNDKILKREATTNFNFLLIIMEQENNIIDSIGYKESINKVSYRLGKDELNVIYKSITEITTEESIKVVKKKLNNYFTNNEETFIEFLNKEKEKSNKDIYKLFFNKYNEYYEKFIKKINNILDNINSHKLKLDTTKISYFTTNNIKLEKIKELFRNPTNNNNNNSGKYTKILPYTDILLVYLLYLLLIIDYLTYFYK